MKIQINTQIIPVQPCTHFIDRLIGMMGKKKKLKNGFYFPKCSSLHTFFMQQNIDILMVNQENKIVAFFSNVKPFRIRHNKSAYDCYEFSTGILTNVEIGMHITIL